MLVKILKNIFNWIEKLISLDGATSFYYRENTCILIVCTETRISEAMP